ncbi:TetR family transcriptional regulator [Actinoplanes derwentensis]|uniref:Regulatory protein, tetR family n=1 Tax=Actinoplanes derwentensis TaxID=113562 RepID=A0A1H1VJL4_9ACTN|nr:TetR family transcriptional regulator [Actinoplanes derwentensis]GID83682.1 TetR family transcriptional regulator [Actinoplanes derwentensis]SDS84710.1 regulatory protein, tetR family [Actinoplanes derwentensis]
MRQRSPQTWRLIRDSAVGLMAERGFDAVSVDDIVATAGISRRTYFNYFAGKESVLFDPDPDDPRLWSELTAARPPGEPLWTALHQLILAYTAAAGEQIVRQCRVIAASPSLAVCSRETCDRFWDCARTWAAGRGTAATGLQLDLLINTARAAFSTVSARWDVDSGIPGLHALIDEAFTLLQSPEWKTL